MNGSRIQSAIFVFLLLLPARATHAQVAQVKELQEQFDNLVKERVTGVYDSDLSSLEADYLANVERSLAEAKASGNLKSALSLQEEIRRITVREALPSDDKEASESLKSLRSIYRAELAKLGQQRVASYAALLTPYVEKLKQLEADLTKADRLTDAKAVMDYRKAFVAAGMPTSIKAGGPMIGGKLAGITVAGTKLPFENGARAFKNRKKFVLSGTPQALVGLKFMQPAANIHSPYKIDLKSKGLLYVACGVDGIVGDKGSADADQAILTRLGFKKTQLSFITDHLVYGVFSKIIDESFTLPPARGYYGFIIIGNLE